MTRGLASVTVPVTVTPAGKESGSAVGVPARTVVGTCHAEEVGSATLPPTVIVTVPVLPVTLPAVTAPFPAAAALLVRVTPAGFANSTLAKRFPARPAAANATVSGALPAKRVLWAPLPWNTDDPVGSL